ncbi:MAG: division/cell wall cluster transcriptional repressor MraZ [Ignavibacteriaceae bacterium]
MVKTLFRGQFTYSVDAKGRVSIPARLRKHVSPEANDTFIMTKGTSTCIDVFPLDAWLKIEEKLNQLNPYDPAHAKFLRMTLQFTAEDNLDSQSRILIPQPLLDYAKIEKDVLILGALKKIEIWNPEIYREYIDQSGETYEQIAAKVMAP